VSTSKGLNRLSHISRDVKRGKFNMDLFTSLCSCPVVIVILFNAVLNLKFIDY